jgi:flagellar protein FliO/FliZ
MAMTQILIAIPALALVLGLILLAARLARAGGFARATGAGGRVTLVQSVALDPRRRMHLVRCDGRHVLLLTGGAQDCVVGWLDADNAGAAP